MTQLLNSPSPTAGPGLRPSARQLPAVPAAVAGALAAVRAALFSLLGLAVLVLLAWLGAGGPAGSSTALHAAALTWLLAHGVDVDASVGTVRLAPLGLLVVPAWTLCAAAGRAVSRCSSRRGRSLGRQELSRLMQGLVVTYTALAVAIALAAGRSPARPSLPGTVLAAALLGTLAGGLGILRALRAAGSWPFPALPARGGTVLAGAVVAVCAMLASGALVLAASLALHADHVNAVARSLHPGALGGVMLALLGVCFVPNAVVCATAYALGPGFAVGASTSVAPSGVVLGTLPSFPMLASLPAPGETSGLGLLPVLFPLVAGVLCGLVVARRAPADVSRDTGAALAAAAGACAGVLLGCLAGLAGGSLGDGRLATVGPSPVRVALVASLELAFAAAASAWLARGRR